jgi:hypothetical protein
MTNAPAAATKPAAKEPEKVPAWHMQLEKELLPKGAVADKDNPALPAGEELVNASIAISLAKIADAYQRNLGLK